ncbi:hypothetical protein Tco_1176393 [Tanacetum coccineum]
MPTEMELTLEQTQQGVSHEVSIVTHWFTLIVLSALRRSDNENMLSTMNLILMCFEKFNTSAGNPVQEDSSQIEIYLILQSTSRIRRLCKMVVECQSVKVKEFQERCNIKAFQEWYEHVGPEVASPQGGKIARWRRDYAWLMISKGSRSLCQIQVQGTSSIQEVNDHYNIFSRERQEYELMTKDIA